MEVWIKKSAKVVEIDRDGHRALEHQRDRRENLERHSSLTDGFLWRTTFAILAMCCQVHKGPYFFFDLDVQNRNAAYDPLFDPPLFVCSYGVLELKNTLTLALYILMAFWMFTSIPSLMKSSQRYQTPDFCLKYPPLYSNRSFFWASHILPRNLAYHIIKMDWRSAQNRFSRHA